MNPFRMFLVRLLHQYDDNTRCVDVHPCPPSDGEPYEHTTLAPRAHRSIITATSAWHHLKPDLTETSPDFCAYSHGFVYTLPPANYSRATMNVIDHIYIGILPRTAHITINRFFQFLCTTPAACSRKRVSTITDYAAHHEYSVGSCQNSAGSSQCA